MAEETDTGVSFARIAEYFQNSRFEYLALEYAGASLRLSSDPFGPDRAAAERIEVRAPAVGFVELPAGRARFPEAHEPVVENEVLFAIRGFKRLAAVSVPASGTLHSILVSAGDFVEFAQPLATWIRAD